MLVGEKLREAIPCDSSQEEGDKRDHHHFPGDGSDRSAVDLRKSADQSLGKVGNVQCNEDLIDAEPKQGSILHNRFVADSSLNIFSRPDLAAKNICRFPPSEVRSLYKFVAYPSIPLPTYTQTSTAISNTPANAQASNQHFVLGIKIPAWRRPPAVVAKDDGSDDDDHPPKKRLLPAPLPPFAAAARLPQSAAVFPHPAHAQPSTRWGSPLRVQRGKIFCPRPALRPPPDAVRDRPR
jgi:hypothetical protein